MTASGPDDVAARALEQLAFRYASTLDDRDQKGFAALFTENAVLTVARRTAMLRRSCHAGPA